MDIYKKIDRVGYLVGRLGFDIELSDDGKSFIMDDVTVVATLDSIDEFIVYLEKELATQ